MNPRGKFITLEGIDGAGKSSHLEFLVQQVKARGHEATLTPDELTQPIPADDHHRHFGGGQTEAMVSLPSGKHTLQLILGDWTHIPHAPPVMSDVITVTVR